MADEGVGGAADLSVDVVSEHDVSIAATRAGYREGGPTDGETKSPPAHVSADAREIKTDESSKGSCSIPDTAAPRLEHFAVAPPGGSSLAADPSTTPPCFCGGASSAVGGRPIASAVASTALGLVLLGSALSRISIPSLLYLCLFLTALENATHAADTRGMLYLSVGVLVLATLSALTCGIVIIVLSHTETAFPVCTLTSGDTSANTTAGTNTTTPSPRALSPSLACLLALDHHPAMLFGPEVALIVFAGLATAALRWDRRLGRVGPLLRRPPDFAWVTDVILFFTATIYPALLSLPYFVVWLFSMVQWGAQKHDGGTASNMFADDGKNSKSGTCAAVWFRGGVYFYSLLFTLASYLVQLPGLIPSVPVVGLVRLVGCPAAAAAAATVSGAANLSAVLLSSGDPSCIAFGLDTWYVVAHFTLLVFLTFLSGSQYRMSVEARRGEGLDDKHHKLLHLAPVYAVDGASHADIGAKDGAGAKERHGGDGGDGGDVGTAGIVGSAHDDDDTVENRSMRKDVGTTLGSTVVLAGSKFQDVIGAEEGIGETKSAGGGRRTRRGGAVRAKTFVAQFQTLRVSFAAVAAATASVPSSLDLIHRWWETRRGR